MSSTCSLSAGTPSAGRRGAALPPPRRVPGERQRLAGGGLGRAAAGPRGGVAPRAAPGPVRRAGGGPPAHDRGPAQARDGAPSQQAARRARRLGLDQARAGPALAVG